MLAPTYGTPEDFSFVRIPLKSVRPHIQLEMAPTHSETFDEKVDSGGPAKTVHLHVCAIGASLSRSVKSPLYSVIIW